MAVATVESVRLMPHFAKTAVTPAKKEEPNAYNIHICQPSFLSCVRCFVYETMNDLLDVPSYLGWSPIFMLFGCCTVAFENTARIFTMRAVMLKITIDPAQFAGYEKKKILAAKSKTSDQHIPNAQIPKTVVTVI